MAERNSFRLGFVGAGQVVQSNHLPGVLASTELRVTAIVDTLLSRADAAIAMYGVESCKAHESMESAANEVDGFVIATPNHLHFENAMKSLSLGKPCLVEKPLTVTATEGEKLCAEARARKLTLAVGYSTRFRDEIIAMKNAVQSTRFGRVRGFLYQHGVVGGWVALSGYTASHSQAGGGVLTATGSHILDQIIYWFGEPRDYQLYDDGVDGPEAHCIVRLSFDTPHGVVDGSVVLSKRLALPGGVSVETDAGRLVMSAGEPELYFMPGDAPDLMMRIESRTRSVFQRDKTIFQLQLEDFAAACRAGIPPLVDGETGLKSVRLLEGLYASRRSLPLAN